ncbi:MAG: diaminopimelate epimerase [Chloroflexi bacterium]|nr:diaminopimelate epimerase [Chloroflexota bacterium]
MRLVKYHALGNDYLVVEPGEVGEGNALAYPIAPARIRAICHRNYGAGADGLLLGPLAGAGCDFALRIFDPDGSEAELSGNGLRIFAGYLWDTGRVGLAPFTLGVAGGAVRARVHAGGRVVTLEMGPASFDSRRISVAGPAREVLNEAITVAGQALRFSAVTLGNPHCVLLREQVSPAEARALGPLIERDPRFPARTNVQFVRVLDHANLQIEIWERGAGYTLASGSGSCAAAAVAHRLGLCAASVTVHMPGGRLEVALLADGRISLTGPVARVWQGVLYEEAGEEAARAPGALPER